MNRFALFLIGGLVLIWDFLVGTRPTIQIHTVDRLDPVQVYMRKQKQKRLAIVAALVIVAGLAVYWGVFAQVPHDYVDIRDHFKYGSIGSDVDSGIPYWLWWVLPDVFPQHLPEPDRYRSLPDDQRDARAAYAQFGFIYEQGQNLPIGFTTRKVVMDRIGLNCAVCHVGTVKASPGMNAAGIYGTTPSYTTRKQDRVIVLGMPAHTVDLSAYLTFLIDCANDSSFDVEPILAAIDKRYHLGPIDRFAYKQAVPQVKAALLQQGKDFTFLAKNPKAGPGRVDTFNPYKNHVFKFPPDNTIGTSDFPSIWNQRPREGMQLHWDGDNKSVFERNISASLGAGATPVSLDMPRMLRVAAWLGAPDPHRDLTEDAIFAARLDPRPRPGELSVPRFPFPIDDSLASRGGAIYRQHCASCHDWQGKFIGQTVQIDKIGTDRHRLESYTSELAANQGTLGAGDWWRFRHFRKTDGYVNMPLDGLWARAPYLHNGSVPTLKALLKKPTDRPRKFFRGDDEFDPGEIGFRSDRPRGDDGRALFSFDTALPGNDNAGHEYGLTLSDDDKKALLEYLKTL